MATIKDGLAQRLTFMKLLRLDAQIMIATGNTADVRRAGLAIEALDQGDMETAIALLKDRETTESIQSQERVMDEQPTGTIALMNDLMVAWAFDGDERACVQTWWNSLASGATLIKATEDLLACLGGSVPDPPDPPGPSDWWIPNDKPRC